MPRELSNCETTERVLHSMRGGEARSLRSILHIKMFAVGGVSVLHKESHIELAGTCGAIFGTNLVLKSSFIAGRHIEITNAAVIGCSNSKTHEVGTHSRHIP